MSLGLVESIYIFKIFGKSGGISFRCMTKTVVLYTESFYLLRISNCSAINHVAMQDIHRLLTLLVFLTVICLGGPVRGADKGRLVYCPPGGLYRQPPLHNSYRHIYLSTRHYFNRVFNWWRVSFLTSGLICIRVHQSQAPCQTCHQGSRQPPSTNRHWGSLHMRTRN